MAEHQIYQVTLNTFNEETEEWSRYIDTFPEEKMDVAIAVANALTRYHKETSQVEVHMIDLRDREAPGVKVWQSTNIRGGRFRERMKS